MIGTIQSAGVGMLYKGAGPGTHWHLNDPTRLGFIPPSALVPTANAVVMHITAYSAPSPFLSLSHSYAIAREYALMGPTGPASRANPGYVFALDFPAIAMPVSLLDPVLAICESANGQAAHHHHGGTALMAEAAQIIPPMAYSAAHQPTGNLGAVSVSSRLQAIIRAVRDSEILAFGAIPAGVVVRRFEVF